MTDQPVETPMADRVGAMLRLMKLGSRVTLTEFRPGMSSHSFPEEVGKALAQKLDDLIDRAAMTPETIVAAAVQIEGLTVSLPRPAGHGEVLALMSELPGYEPGAAGKLQGFVTSEGRFVSRVEAMKIAHRAGQKFRSPPRPPNLFSEDLW